MDKNELTPLPRNELIFDLRMALELNRSFLLARKHRDVNTAILAEVLADHILRSNIRVFRGPPAAPPRTTAPAPK